MVKNPPHSTARQLATKALRQILPSGWHVRSQEPITLSDSEPEPDVAVVRGDLEPIRAFPSRAAGRGVGRRGGRCEP